MPVKAACALHGYGQHNMTLEKRATTSMQIEFSFTPHQLFRAATNEITSDIAGEARCCARRLPTRFAAVDASSIFALDFDVARQRQAKPSRYRRHSVSLNTCLDLRQIHQDGRQQHCILGPWHAGAFEANFRLAIARQPAFGSVTRVHHKDDRARRFDLCFCAPLCP